MVVLYFAASGSARRRSTGGTRGWRRGPAVSGARLGVVVNPTAGHGRGARRGRAAARARCAGAGTRCVDLTGGDLEAALQHGPGRPSWTGSDALVVVGGDGVVHLGANVVAGTDLPLGIVAAGSGNDIARAGGLPDARRRCVGGGCSSTASRPAGRPVDAVRTGPPGYEAHPVVPRRCCPPGSTPRSTRAPTTLHLAAGDGTVRACRPGRAGAVPALRLPRHAGRRGLGADRHARRRSPTRRSFGGGMRIAPDAALGRRPAGRRRSRAR